jgi:DNA polymerase III alpha subunit (gram-positive type)
VALDTDTTSRYSIEQQLLEVGAVCFHLDGRELTTFPRCIDPGVPKPPDVHQVHGITDRVVQGQPTIAHVLPPFIEFLGVRDTILLAHNASFDLGYLAMALTRLRITCPPYCPFDTLDLARCLFPSWLNHI